MSSELTELAASTPERKVKGRELDELKLRREYLEFEVSFGPLVLPGMGSQGEEDRMGKSGRGN